MFKRRKPDSIEGNEPTPPRVGEAGASEGLLDGGAALAGPLGVPSRPADNGLGVPPPPPFRPAPPEVPAMGRTPYPVPPPTGPVPQPPPAPVAVSPAASPPVPPSGPRLAVPPARPREVPERRTLVVGRGIALQGTVQDAERLVVEGTVEASMIHAAELAIAPGGTFKGEVEVGDAEIAGSFDGTLTARGNLVVRASGRVTGTARCRRLQVEDGGQITGRVEMLGDSPPQIAPGQIAPGQIAPAQAAPTQAAPAAAPAAAVSAQAEPPSHTEHVMA